MRQPDHFNNKQPKSSTLQPIQSVELPHIPPPTAPNQALYATSFQLEAGLRYRSVPEVRIARALERAGVLFLPNCMARLTLPNGQRVNREADFLVCYKGHWGVLEVDGEDWHPPERAALEHKRDRVFRRHGLRTVERYDASACLRSADSIVSDFLELVQWRASA